MNQITLKLDEIVFRTDLYPRFKPSPQKIQEYAENLDKLPPIEVDQHNILIDGYHRWKAYETEKQESIPCLVTEVQSEAELERLAVERNSKHGQQLTQDEKRKYAVKWWGIIPDEDIKSVLSISDRSFSSWTKDRRDEKEKRNRQTIYDMYMACYTQEEIAKEVEVDVATINRRIAGFLQNGNFADLQNFRNFEHRKIYTIWNFDKANNQVKHFGNIPPEIIDNLLYYYTKPFDVIFDPFGGGGSTIDVCLERKRRYYVSDLTPVPARSDIRQWDITQGLPNDLPVPDFVFLDPPYWKQAEEKYSEKETDLANVELDQFLTTIGDIAKQVKRKWNGSRPDGKLALIIGPWKNEGEYLDLPFLCYQVIAKYLKPVIRIQVPYSTQVHGGNYVNMAKEKKELLYLSRDLMVFGL
jgi:16S rRNA G966 N2-methylase RsmD